MIRVPTEMTVRRGDPLFVEAIVDAMGDFLTRSMSHPAPISRSRGRIES